MVRPNYKEFARLARTATLVPVVKSISADLLTPVSAFLAVADGEPDAFLLESVEGGEKIGRYTFLGVRPFLRLESRGTDINIESSGRDGAGPALRAKGLRLAGQSPATTQGKSSAALEMSSKLSKNSCSNIVPRQSKACRRSPPAR